MFLLFEGSGLFSCFLYFGVNKVCDMHLSPILESNRDMGRSKSLMPHPRFLIYQALIWIFYPRIPHTFD